MRERLKMSTTVWAALVATSCVHSPDQVRLRPIACHSYPDWGPVKCDVAKDDSVVVSMRSIAKIHFSSEGLGSIIVDSRGLYFVTHSGKTAPALLFDNGPDYFVEGLARTLDNGKVGFVNTKLDQVVAPVWDFAFPFEHGVAVVCTGCVRTPVSPHSEHWTMTGGKWGYIDRHGRTVVPVVYESRSLPPLESAERFAIQ
jgi:hypothetical protein